MISFRVRGEPKTQGSTRAFIRGGRPIITSDTKGLKPWRDVIGWEAQRAMGGGEPYDGPVSVKLRFTLRRPKGQWSVAGIRRPSAPPFPATKPDVDKLVRAALDALTGVCYLDDAQVVSVTASKRYQSHATEPMGVTLSVEPLVDGMGLAWDPDPVDELRREGLV